MKIKVLSLFSGIGAFEAALDRLDIEYELINYCEIDKYASKAYSAVHGVSEELNLWDVSKVDTSRLPKDIDLLTHGSPCQDFSLAGLNAGGDKGSGTRSSLMYETLRIVNDIHPRVVIWENVKNLLSQKHRHNFDAYLETMRGFGYVNYYKVLNAKDYGIPQNRERVFTLSISKDIDEGFEFPKPMKLNLRLKDMLEDDVDEKYYLSEAMVNYCMGVNQKESKFPRKERFLSNINRSNQDIAVTISTLPGNRPVDNFLKIKCGEVTDEPFLESDSFIAAMRGRCNDDGKYEQKLEQNNEGICNTLTTVQKDSLLVKATRLGGIFDTEKSKHQAGSVWDKDGLSPTLDTMQGGYRQPCIEVPENTKKGYAEAYDGDGAVLKGMKIRKLTPKECWRLMGFTDEDFEKAQSAGLSNTQLYKQAGNSIVVNVLVEIFRNLYLEKC